MPALEWFNTYFIATGSLFSFLDLPTNFNTAVTNGVLFRLILHWTKVILMIMGLGALNTFLFYPFFSMELLSQLEPQCLDRITFSCFLASCSLFWLV